MQFHTKPIPADSPRWQQEEAVRLRDQILNDTITTDGVVRWTMGNIVPPGSFRDAFLEVPEGQQAGYAADTERFLNEYREARRNYKPSAEEMFEMQAAFGAGETVVDVITGQTFSL